MTARTCHRWAGTQSEPPVQEDMALSSENTPAHKLKSVRLTRRWHPMRYRKQHNDLPPSVQQEAEERARRERHSGHSEDLSSAFACSPER